MALWENKERMILNNCSNIVPSVTLYLQNRGLCHTILIGICARKTFISQDKLVNFLYCTRKIIWSINFLFCCDCPSYFLFHNNSHLSHWGIIRAFPTCDFWLRWEISAPLFLIIKQTVVFVDLIWLCAVLYVFNNEILHVKNRK